MKRIESFNVDHTRIKPGIYVSRIDGDITTYDMRVKTPNTGDIINNSTLHSVEHMFATYIRNSSIADDIIYFGPMGCQTGFYLLVRNADNNTVFDTVILVLKQIIAYDGPVFGASEIECGNYLNLDADLAKNMCLYYLDVLSSSSRSFNYY